MRSIHCRLGVADLFGPSFDLMGPKHQKLELSDWRG